MKISLTLLAVFIILLILILGGNFLIRGTLVTKNPPSPTFTTVIVSPTPESTTQQSSPSATTTLDSKPLVTTPQPNTKVESPLTIKGTVPAGWMFEGVFPVKLLDSKRNFIAQTQAKEVTPGSWSSGQNVEFSAILNFSTTEQSGFIILEKDNPSGLPENAESFEINVRF